MTPTELEAWRRIEAALSLIYDFAAFDGAHHKQWVIDQVVQMLTADEEEYNAWVARYNEDGNYHWEKGIAP
jgi:hypothetical protein